MCRQAANTHCLCLSMCLQTLSDGKPIIIEGMHLDPGLYIHDFGQRGIIMLPARPTTAMQLARSPRPAAAPESASRPPYKRSLTAMACSRAGAVSAVSASAAEADDDCTAADGRQFGRCVSADAELPVLVAPASAPIGSHAGRPRSAGVSGMRGATLAAGEELSAGAEVAADPPAAAVEGTQAADELDQMLQGSGQALLQQQVSGVEQRCNGTMLLQHHQKGTCEPAVGNYAGSDTNQCTVVECLPAALAAAQQPEVVSQTRGVLASSSSSTFMHLVSSTGSSSDNIVHTYEEMSTYRAAAADVAQLSLAESNQAASAAALSWPLCASSSGQLTAAPTVIMLDQLHVCAATAEAVALQQQALQLEQQPRLSVSIVSPGSPLSDSTALADPSPCISQEHSTTDVVSRQPSFNSPSPTLLSQEPSASDVGLGLGCSPAAVHLQQAAANAASAEGEPCSSVSCSVSALNLQGSLQPEQQQQQHEVVPLVEGPSNGLHAVLEVEQSQKQPASQQQDQQQGLPEDAAVAASTGNTSANASLVAHASVQKLVSSSSAEGSGAHPTQPETSIQAMTGITEQQQQPVSPAAEQQQFEPRADARDAAAAHSENAEVYASAGPVADGAGQKGQLHSDSSKRVGQQQLDRKGHAQKPLFVPVLVYMDEADHALMQEQASPHMGLSMGRSNAADAGAASSQVGHGSAGSRASKGAQETSSRVAAAGAVDGSDESLEAPGTVQAAAAVGSQEALRRMRLLQEYLCAYEAQGLPVVKVSYGNFSEALDKLHEYILQCIKVAMQL